MNFKKSILSVLATVSMSAMVGCTDAEDLYLDVAKDNSISFSPYINRNSRGASLTSENITDFGVFAYHDLGKNYASGNKVPNYMYNQIVARNGISWTYNPVKYWPADETERISFFAYAPYCAAAAMVDDASTSVTEMSANDASGDPTLRFSVGTNVANHVDLVYANAIDRTNTMGTVYFQFKHALSRVGFNAIGWDSNTGEYDNNTTVTINSVKLATNRKEATLNLNTGEWSDPTESASLRSFTLSTRNDMLVNNVIVAGDAAKQLNKADDYIMMLPDISGDDEYILFVDYTVETHDASLSDGSHTVRNNVYSRFKPHFEAGKAYTINIHLGMDGGGFPGSEDSEVPVDPDPDPENPITPTSAGNFGPVRFSTTVDEWENSDVDIPDEVTVLPLYTKFENFTVTGSVEPLSRASVQNLKVKSLKNPFTKVDALKNREITVNGESFTLTKDDIDYNNVEAGVQYVLTLSDENGTLYKGHVSMDYAEMAFTIDTKWGSYRQFNTGLVVGQSMPADVFIAWGDGTQSDIITTVTADDNYHYYDADGIYKVKILSSQTDPSQPQLCDYTIAKRATTVDARQVISMDTPLLSNISNKLDYMFNDCSRMKSVPGNVFMNFPDVTAFNNVFLGCVYLYEIPEDLFQYTNGQVVTMSGTFQNCRNVKALPVNLFKNLNVKTCRYVFCNNVSLKEIPADLFKYNPDIESFAGVFGGCDALEKAPMGLFAHNLKASDFKEAFAQDHKLVDFENIFISSPEEKATRFSSLNQPLDLSSMFAVVGTDTDANSSGYNAINFNEYTIPVGTYGKPYNGATTGWANYADITNFY